jgi:hypothetical protein
MDIGSSAGSMKESVQLAGLAKLGITGVGAMSLINMGLESADARKILAQTLASKKGISLDKADEEVRAVLGGAMTSYDKFRGRMMGGGSMLDLAKTAIGLQGTDQAKRVLAMGDESLMAGIAATGGNIRDVNVLMSAVEQRQGGGNLMKVGLNTLTATGVGQLPEAPKGERDIISEARASQEAALQDAMAQIPGEILRSVAKGFDLISETIRRTTITPEFQDLKGKIKAGAAKEINPNAKSKGVK